MPPIQLTPTVQHVVLEAPAGDDLLSQIIADHEAASQPVRVPALVKEDPLEALMRMLAEQQKQIKALSDEVRNLTQPQPMHDPYLDHGYVQASSYSGMGAYVEAPSYQGCGEMVGCRDAEFELVGV